MAGEMTRIEGQGTPRWMPLVSTLRYRWIRGGDALVTTPFHPGAVSGRAVRYPVLIHWIGRARKNSWGRARMGIWKRAVPETSVVLI